MGNLIVVVGNSGVGKSTFTRFLRDRLGLVVGLEEQAAHPFQLQFNDKPSLAFANQVDYLLVRAEQEYIIRTAESDGIQDGGLEMDYFGFTRLFHMKGWLNDAELAILGNMYAFIRRIFPPPDLVIHLQASPDVITKRFLHRHRELEIVTLSDLERIDTLLNEWLVEVPPQKVIHIDTTSTDPSFKSIMPLVLDKISTIVHK